MTGNATYLRFSQLPAQPVSIGLVRRRDQLVDCRNVLLDPAFQALAERRLLGGVDTPRLLQHVALEVAVGEELIQVRCETDEEEVLLAANGDLAERPVPGPEATGLFVEAN